MAGGGEEENVRGRRGLDGGLGDIRIFEVTKPPPSERKIDLGTKTLSQMMTQVQGAFT